MGALIQTKGTQRLASLFNKRFDFAGGASTRSVTNSVGATLLSAFSNTPNNTTSLLTISDSFIAQNAVQGTWPADMNDFLYPSATLLASAAVSGNNTLTFTLPTGFNACGSGCAIAQGSSVYNLNPSSPNIPKGTTVSLAPAVSGRTLTVTVSTNVTVAQGDMINFAIGNHQRLVRRWRWYLQHDLKVENHAAIQLAIQTALQDTDFQKINFHTVEDKQRAIITPRSTLDPNNDELSDKMEMLILLMTESTTAPDKLDPQ